MAGSCQGLGVGLFAVLAVLAVFAAGITAPVQAETTYWQLSHNLRAGFNDNYALSESSPRQVRRLSQNVAATLAYADERSRLSSRVQSTFQRFYGDDQGLSSAHSPLLDLQAAHQLSERSSFAADLSVGRDKTSADEFVENRFFSGLFLLANEDQDIRRDRYNTNLIVDHRLSEYWQASVFASSQALRYDDSRITNLIAYDYYSLGGRISHSVSERLSSFVQGSYSDYQPDPSGAYQARLNVVASQTLNLRLGLSYVPDESSQISGSFGFRESDYDFVNTGRNGRDNGGVLSFDYQKRWSQGVFNASYSRELSPSSDGVATDIDSFSLKLKRPWSAQLEPNLIAKFERERSDGFGGKDKDLWSLTALFNYRAAPAHQLSLGLRHRRIDERGGDHTGANILFFSWRWTGDKHWF